MNKRWIIWLVLAYLAAVALIAAASVWLDPAWLAQPNGLVKLLIEAATWAGGAALAVATVVIAYWGLDKNRRSAVRGRIQPARPGDDIPQPGELPDGSKHPPFGSNPHFTGRDDDLRLLSERLVDDPQPRPVVLTGTGGSGKSQLAGEFLYRYGRQFVTVHWINAAQPELIEGELADCGRAMHIQPWPQAQPEQVEAVLLEWHKDPRRLVVFDNLEQPSVLRGWLPRLGKMRVLVTARYTDWRDDLGMTVNKVEPLDPNPGRGLLRGLAPRLVAEPDAALDALTARLGGLPLALDLAGRHFAQRETLTPQGFLQELNQQGGTAGALAFTIQGKDTATQHATDLIATFLGSWDLLAALDPVNGLARRIFRCAGWCAPNTPIPPALLEGAVESLAESEALDQALQPGAFELALVRLYDLGLLERGAGGPAVHPLLADFARVVEGLPSCELAVADTLIEMGIEANNSGLHAEYLPLLAHVELAAGREAQLSPQQAPWLWNSLGRYYRAIAAYARARPALERALAIGAQVLPPGHPDLGTWHNNLGDLLRDLGELPEAREHLERALAISEQALPPGHPTLGTRHNNLGSLLRAMGALPEAREHLERALAISEQALPPGHPTLGTRHNNLGLLLKDMGELPAAREHLEQALAISQQSLPPEHPALGTLHNNLGLLLQALGELPEAREHLERALAIDEQALGKDHPGVATDLNNLGLLLKDLGELPEARAHLERALGILTAALPVNHPHILWARENMDALKRQMGDDSGTNER